VGLVWKIGVLVLGNWGKDLGEWGLGLGEGMGKGGSEGLRKLMIELIFCASFFDGALLKK
jgi:hypothetical protein